MQNDKGLSNIGHNLVAVFDSFNYSWYYNKLKNDDHTISAAIFLLELAHVT